MMEGTNISVKHPEDVCRFLCMVCRVNSIYLCIHLDIETSGSITVKKCVSLLSKCLFISILHESALNDFVYMQNL